MLHEMKWMNKWMNECFESNEMHVWIWWTMMKWWNDENTNSKCNHTMRCKGWFLTDRWKTYNQKCFSWQFDSQPMIFCCLSFVVCLCYACSLVILIEKNDTINQLCCEIICNSVKCKCGWVNVCDVLYERFVVSFLFSSSSCVFLLFY